MNFFSEMVANFIKVIQNYVGFSGRADRREYWMFVLANIIISAVFSILGRGLSFFYVLSGLYSLAVLLPSWAVAFRRLHDIGKSGYWVFVCLIPLVGWIWFLILMAKEGDVGSNQYG